MDDFKVNMLDEAKYLSEKIFKLEEFTETNKEFLELPFLKRVVMKIQLFYMRRYYFWLSQRINWICTKGDLAEYETLKDTFEDTEVKEEVVIENIADKNIKTKRRAKKSKTNE